MRSKHAHLLRDTQLRRWNENVARGSRTTASVYLRHLGVFLTVNRMSPTALLRLAPEDLHNLLLDNVTAMENRGLSGGYITSVLKAVKSWLGFNGVVVTRKIKVRGARETPTLRDERVPTQDELRQILLSGDDTARAVCVLLAQSGLRLEVLGSSTADDGLRVADLPDVVLEGKTVTVRTMPALVRVRSTLSKTGREYFTFLSEEGWEYVKGYLERRMREGEVLTPESALVAPKTAKHRFVSTTKISDYARTAMRRAGIPWRPYVLRSFFDTQMMLAESKGLIIRDYRSFFMGHKGDIEAVYTLNKSRLPADIVSEMRTAYARAQRFIQTTPKTMASSEDVTRTFKRQLLLAAGMAPDEIADDHLDLDDGAFQRVLREVALQRPSGEAPGQKVVGLPDLDHHLAEGWEFVSLLPNEKVILRRSVRREAA